MAVRAVISTHEILRRQAGYTVTALARELGVSHTYVSRVEGGEITPSPRYREGAARALGVAEIDLFPEGDAVMAGVG